MEITITVSAKDYYGDSTEVSVTIDDAEEDAGKATSKAIEQLKKKLSSIWWNS